MNTKNVHSKPSSQTFSMAVPAAEVGFFHISLKNDKKNVPLRLHKYSLLSKTF